MTTIVMTAESLTDTQLIRARKLIVYGMNIEFFTWILKHRDVSALMRHLADDGFNPPVQGISGPLDPRVT